MKTMKKAVSLILAVAMLISVCSFTALADETASVTLTDIDYNSTVGKAVSRLVSTGIINGYPDGTYKADNTITRAEFSVVMVKFEGMQNSINAEALTGFEDLDLDENYAWVRPYVALAVQRGIINGFEDNTFRAADPVTYEQAVKMIMCALGYGESAKTPTIEGDWSSGYIAKAQRLGVTKNTSIANKTNAVTRGTVAILANNALDADRADITNANGDVILQGGTSFEGLDYKEVSGIVTGTYLTELESQRSNVAKNHIQIDDKSYEIDFSRDPNEFLGCNVDAVLEKNDDGDFVVKSIELNNKTNVTQIQSELLGNYEDGTLEYQTKRDGSWKDAKVEDEYVVIYNNKLYDYDLANLKDDLEIGYVELIDNNGNKKADVVKIHSYDVFVVSSKTTSTQKITLMYGATYEGETSIVFPEESTSLVFSLTRNGKEITFNDIAKWDVLNIKASPADADGRRYYEVVVTRNTVTGMVTEMDEADKTYVTIGNTEYMVADSYLNFKSEDKAELVTGENAQVYLDAFNRIVATAETTVGTSAETYAYMWGVRQDSDNSDYDLEFWLYTTSGKELKIGSASKITIDGTKYKALDEDILEVLEKSAEVANGNYKDAENVKYQQPIIYQTNSEGLISTIYTVNSTDNDDISAVMNDEGAGDIYFVPYNGARTYKSASKSFTDFKVSSSTKIIFVPDNRSATDDYLTFTSYSKAFANSRDYHVEAYGLTSSKTAALVLIYCENDSRIYTSASPWMIVASKSDTSSGTVIKGYGGTSYSLRSVKVSEDDGPSISSIGRGDIIRYIVDGSGELIDYQIWFDASDPVQIETCSNIDDAIDKRTLEIHSTSTEPRKNYPSATFRLQYGTVTELILKENNKDIEEETITVSPTIVGDGVDMAFTSDGVVSRTINSSVKIFMYDRGGRNSEVLTEVDISEILDYETYGEDASRVITYSASGTLRMIYIIID